MRIRRFFFYISLFFMISIFIDFSEATGALKKDMGPVSRPWVRQTWEVLIGDNRRSIESNFGKPVKTSVISTKNPYLDKEDLHWIYTYQGLIIAFIEQPYLPESPILLTSLEISNLRLLKIDLPFKMGQKRQKIESQVGFPDEANKNYSIYVNGFDSDYVTLFFLGGRLIKAKWDFYTD